MKSSSSCWRVASRRSKRCPARAKAVQASSSAGSSPRCTVLRARGQAGDTAPPRGTRLSPILLTCPPCGHRRRSHPRWPGHCRAWPRKTAPPPPPGRRRRTARKPEEGGQTREKGSQGTRGGDMWGAGPAPCPTGLTARPSGVEKSRSSRSVSLSRGRSRSWRVPFTRATSAASARPPLRGQQGTPWGPHGDSGDPAGILGQPRDCGDPGDTARTLGTL